MVWFNNDVVKPEMLFDNYLNRLRNLPIDTDAKNSVDDLLASMTISSKNEVMKNSTMEGSLSSSMIESKMGTSTSNSNLRLQNVCATALQDHFSSDGICIQVFNVWIFDELFLGFEFCNGKCRARNGTNIAALSFGLFLDDELLNSSNFGLFFLAPGDF